MATVFRSDAHGTVCFIEIGNNVLISSVLKGREAVSGELGA